MRGMRWHGVERMVKSSWWREYDHFAAAARAEANGRDGLGGGATDGFVG